MKKDLTYVESKTAISPTESNRYDRQFGIGNWRIVNDIMEDDEFAGRVILTGKEPRQLIETTPRGFISKNIDYDFVAKYF